MHSVIGNIPDFDSLLYTSEILLIYAIIYNLINLGILYLRLILLFIYIVNMLSPIQGLRVLHQH